MNIFELLNEDHRRVQGLLEEIHHTSARAIKKKQQLFMQVREELELHTYIEENIVYPAFDEIEALHDSISEGFEEHDLFKQLLYELTMLSPQAEQWDAKMTALSELLDHHISDEENEMFGGARKAMSGKRAQELADLVIREKQDGVPADIMGTWRVENGLGRLQP